MDYAFDKEPLAAGSSYTLRRSILDRELLRGGVTNVHSVSYMRAHDTPWLVLGAHYAGNDPRWPDFFVPPRRVHLRIHAVPSTERHEGESTLIAALPELVSWLRTCETRPETWRTEPHVLRFVLEGGEIRSEEDPRDWRYY